VAQAIGVHASGSRHCSMTATYDHAAPGPGSFSTPASSAVDRIVKTSWPTFRLPLLTSADSTVERRHERGKNFSIIVVAEGARLADDAGQPLHEQRDKRDEFGHIRLGGVGASLAERIEETTGYETRYSVLGHIQRGGSPTAFDRVLGSRFGVSAVDLVARGGFGRMVAIRGTAIVDVPLAEALGSIKQVGPELYDMARVFFS